MFLFSVLIFVVAVASTIAGLWWFNRPSDPQAGPNQSASEIPEPPKPVSLSSRILFTGNTFWGRYTNDRSMKEDLKYAYPFSRLSDFNRDKYDAWISGLECPTVPGLNLSSSAQEATLSFNCPPEYLEEASKWFTAFTLANNHTDNQGVDGFKTTKKQLDKAGIQYFGHYDFDASEPCNIISIDTNITYDDETVEKTKIPLVFCGFHGVFGIPTDASIAKIKEYSEYIPVIAMPHMGAEYQPVADQIKAATYRKMIDYGAEFVMGDHPHWVQNTEAYNSKLIVYSMGNFMFDQQFSTEVTRSALIDVTMTSTNPTANLTGWAEITDQCKEQGITECIALAKEKNLQKLSFNYKFDVLGSTNMNYLVKKATKSELDSIKQRLNWSSTMRALGQ